MPGSYTYVDGAHLGALLLQVREQFLARPPYEPDGTRRPNSVRLVAIGVIADKSTDERLAVLSDLIGANPALVVERDASDVFAYADTPATYVTDLICAVVCQILARDPSIRLEDEWRVALADESGDVLEEQWRQAADGRDIW